MVWHAEVSNTSIIRDRELSCPCEAAWPLRVAAYASTHADRSNVGGGQEQV
jgi:hypothetical protein